MDPHGSLVEAVESFFFLVKVDESMSGYMEAHGSFHRTYPWKLQFVEAMEAADSTDSGNFLVFPWKL